VNELLELSLMCIRDIIKEKIAKGETKEDVTNDASITKKYDNFY